ncbi:Disks large-like protein 5 [Microtus ochrogaster]|uniref:Disks large-like protein 5 n=1 Tax=Microtus ochrogaster TaxID=79684 RepID=A0A8J6GH43_MICOH|nr:Disks large-like protein 5 [Microtus ochrogaster]
MQNPGQARATRAMDPSPWHPWPGVSGVVPDPSLHRRQLPRIRVLLLPASVAPADAAIEPKSQPILLTKKQMKQEVDRLTTELQLITSQRNEQQDHLTFISEDTMENRPYHKPNPFYEKLKLEHAQVMSELRTLEADYTETSEKFSELTKETVFYQ